MSTSFADDLLNDLGENDEEQENGDGSGNGSDLTKNDEEMTDDHIPKEDGEDYGNNGEHLQDRNPSLEEVQIATVESMDLRPESVSNIFEVCTLMRSSKVKDSIEKIKQFSSSPKPNIDGILENSPEYKLIVQANNLAVDVDNEISIAHKFIRQHYKPRFPELESLIANPWEFVHAVRAIGNHDNLAKAKLDGILPHGLVVVISMQAATTKGRRLSADAWKQVEDACDLVIQLDETRKLILTYVESRMSMIAPNLSKVVGSQVATKLLGIAGGLNAFIKIPACNVMLLGASNRAAPGLSTAFSDRHKGFIVQAPLIQSIPEEYHRQAIRIVSAKAILAARVDAGRSDVHGVYGARMRIELEQKLEKLQEPPPAKMVKALPIPKEGGKKNRRGGRKARKFKERNGMSDLRKLQNRVRFGEEEEETGAFDESEGMGMLNSKKDSGLIRSQVANKETKARMSKRNNERIKAIQQGSGSSSFRLDNYFGDNISNGDQGSLLGSSNGKHSDEISGTVSTLSFTPLQGIELSDPSRQKKVEEANAKWFKEGMFSLAPGKSNPHLSPIGTLMGPPSSLSSFSSNKKQRKE